MLGYVLSNILYIPPNPLVLFIMATILEKERERDCRQDSRRCGLLSIGDCFCFEEGEIEQERGGLERITERIHTKGLQFLISRSLFFGLVLESAQGCQIQEPVEKVYSTHQ